MGKSIRHKWVYKRCQDWHMQYGFKTWSVLEVPKLQKTVNPGPKGKRKGKTSNVLTTKLSRCLRNTWRIYICLLTKKLGTRKYGVSHDRATYQNNNRIAALQRPERSLSVEVKQRDLVVPDTNNSRRIRLYI